MLSVVKKYKKTVYILLISLLVLLTANSFSQINSSADFINFEGKSYTSKMNFIVGTATDNYNIIYHRILWEVNPATYFIKGEVTSYFKTLENNMGSICFDLIDTLIVDSVKQNNTLLFFTHSDNLLKITLSKSLNMGVIDSITIFYQGMPYPLSNGFGSFQTSTHNDVPVLWTLSEPYGAREWWPCKQSLTDKIDSIDIYIKTPPQYKVGSNGILMFEKIEGESKLTWWKHRYPIAAYLVAIAVTNYESYSHFAMVNETDSVEILNYVYPENRDNAEKNTEFTVKVLELFSNLFIPYPFKFEKYGHAQFGWGGGMEHQTMSFMGNFSEKLITHELAHQWFGNHVTCGSWQHIWVNEGFAVFCEYIAQEHLYPDDWVNWKKNRMDYVLKNAKSGSVFVEDTTDVGRIFDRALTYEKGGIILQSLRTQIGDKAFFAGIKELLINSKINGGFATASNVQLYFEEAADTNLTTFFNNWYYGQGYPNYAIKWVQNLNNQITLTISQTTTHFSVPFFAMYVTVLLKGSDKEKLVTFHNITNHQEFTYNANFIVDEVIFDPNYNIIANHPADINLDIKETELKTQIIVMPNPTNNSIIVTAINDTKFNKIDIISISGKHVYNSNSNKNRQNADINISNLSTGIYYIRINTNNGLIIKKFVKSN